MGDRKGHPFRGNQYTHRDRLQSRFFEVEHWYDRHTRNWVASTRYRNTGDPTSIASVTAYRKESIKKIGISYFAGDLARELSSKRNTPYDPRPQVSAKNKASRVLKLSRKIK